MFPRPLVMINRALPTALLVTTLLVAAACTPAPETETHTVASTKPADVVFTDVTETAGIAFSHHNGRSGQKLLPETLGSGVVFFDYDNDARPDLLLVNSRPWEAQAEPVTSKLYRNNGDGSFTDVTAGSGLETELFAIGAAAGDYDNDGLTDLYVTALEGDRLYRNTGNGTFADVTASAGIDNANFGTSVAFLDYDRDGLLDLFVDNYVVWSPELDVWCTLDGSTKSYCTPGSYTGVASKLYRNLGEGRFEDVSEAAGVSDPESKALGIAILDFDADGWPDIFQANDTQPNKLYRNNQDGTFTDIGLTAGVAFAEDGKARGAMGVDAADYDGSGRPHLLVGNFSNEMLNLFHNEGGGLFLDDAPASDIGKESLLALTFGAFFFDYNLDGALDVFAANGHLDEEINAVQPKVTFEQAPLLFRNDGTGRFLLANSEVGEAFSTPLVARGAAYADYDSDGDLDVVINVNNGAARLYRNDGGNANSYVRLHLVGKESNRSAFGAKVTVTSASGKQSRMVRSGSSYASQSESTLTFGIGQDLLIDVIEVEWPSGETQRFEKVEPNQSFRIEESVDSLAVQTS